MNAFVYPLILCSKKKISKLIVEKYYIFRITIVFDAFSKILSHCESVNFMVMNHVCYSFDWLLWDKFLQIPSISNQYQSSDINDWMNVLQC